MRGRKQVEEGAPVEKEPDREPVRAGRGGEKAARGIPEASHRALWNLHQSDFTRGVGTETGGCGWRKHNCSLFLIAREGARWGCGWRDSAEGSVGFAPSGGMARDGRLRGGIQREGCDSHLVLLHLPPHPSPSPRALSGSSYLASPPSTCTPGPGGPGLPAGSPLLASFLELVSTAGGWMGGGLPSGDIQDLGLL